ncbi:hypothetical protein G5714_004825 [Onychostoma macrolepis]|uniref:Uncharacterized protein n=1 Tax=Onychostoma macrolepis TaxID=369639 RepID=A0A7J6D5W7_9TELE|nr:hypothetical protein G5714_004825 [Onychostoma macrolepis]
MAELGFLKICFIGTAFSFLVVLFGLVDSVGGLMYPQGLDWADDSWTEKLPTVSPSRTATAANNTTTKRNGSRQSSRAYGAETEAVTSCSTLNLTHPPRGEQLFHRHRRRRTDWLEL